MGWRGTVRTLGAMARQAERDSARRAREHAKYIAAVERQDLKEKAADAVRSYDQYVADLVSIHTRCSAQTDWKVRANKAAPTEPTLDDVHQRAAIRALSIYKPSFFAKIFGGESKARAALESAVHSAPDADKREFEQRKKQYLQDLADHEDEVTFAKRILAGDQEGLLEAVKLFEPLANINFLGEHLHVSVIGPGRIGLELRIHGEEILPKDRPKLLASGRASVKPMPKSEYHRLYQDHVCSACLRAAREMLGLLPVDEVTVTAVDDLLNAATGHLETVPILSFVAPRATLERLNFAAIDPSDSMKNFVHRMEFSSTTGFKPTERVVLDSGALVGARAT